jgi:hypothetical protein
MRSMAMIGAAGIFAMVLLLLGWGLWSVLGGDRSGAAANAASSLAARGSGARSADIDQSPGGVATGAVATSTPSLPAVPTSTSAVTSAIGVGSPSSTTSATRSSSSSPTSSTGPAPTTSTRTAPSPWGVTKVTFTCSLTGRRVQAVLTFTSTETVTAVVRAAGTTTTKTGVGAVSVTVSGLTAPSDCWAAVDGHTIGTIPAT